MTDVTETLLPVTHSWQRTRSYHVPVSLAGWFGRGWHLPSTGVAISQSRAIETFCHLSIIHFVWKTWTRWQFLFRCSSATVPWQHLTAPGNCVPGVWTCDSELCLWWHPQLEYPRPPLVGAEKAGLDQGSAWAVWFIPPSACDQPCMSGAERVRAMLPLLLRSSIHPMTWMSCVCSALRSTSESCQSRSLNRGLPKSILIYGEECSLKRCWPNRSLTTLRGIV